MDPHIVAEMAEIEEHHWWYVALRDWYERLLSTPRFAVPPRPRVLDAGCGTGATLRFLHERLRPAYLGGFDRDPLCLESAERKCPTADLYTADFGSPIFREDEFDLIVSCEVMSYVESASRPVGLQRLAERLAPGGRLLLHVPACPALFSRHDRAVGTLHRFTADEVRRLVEGVGLTIELLSHRISLLFPAVAAQRFFSRRSTDAKTSDLGRSTGWMGAVCRRITQFENAAVCRGVKFPIGASLVCVARRAERERRENRNAVPSQSPGLRYSATLG